MASIGTKDVERIWMVVAKVWLSAVLLAFLVLRVVESRAFGRLLHAFSFR